jgi:hypothetical protein
MLPPEFMRLPETGEYWSWFCMSTTGCGLGDAKMSLVCPPVPKAQLGTSEGVADELAKLVFLPKMG